MKVLELVLKWGRGGVERYVEDLVAAASAHGIDCSVASVTTAVDSMRVDGAGPLVSGGVGGALVNGSAVSSFVTDGDYDIVHIHGNNGLVFHFAHLAVKGGAKAIVHSHNSSFGRGARCVKSLFTYVERRLYFKYCSGMLACSHAAGDFLFARDKYQLALNGIDVSRFAFNVASRSEVRMDYGIQESAAVLGFAASFVDAKNPLFVLNVFEEYSKRNPNAYLLVCGDGELFDNFKRQAAGLISDGRCICVGRVDDVERYYCAMDVLLAPSKYEGLPINLIEAQATGLAVVMSNAITNEVVIAPELCARLSLDDSEFCWANAADGFLGRMRSRSIRNVDVVKKAGYSQPACFDSVLNMYEELAG